MADKEYIEREALVRASCERCNGEYVPCNKEHCLLMEVIHSIPAADVRPVVRGKWEEKEKDGVLWYACSACGEHIPKGRWGQEWHSRFCPNCGARMEES